VQIREQRYHLFTKGLSRTFFSDVNWTQIKKLEELGKRWQPDLPESEFRSAIRQALLDNP